MIRGGVKKKFLKLTEYLCSVKSKSQRHLDQKKGKYRLGVCVCACVGLFQTKMLLSTDYSVDNS